MIKDDRLPTKDELRKDQVTKDETTALTSTSPDSWDLVVQPTPQVVRPQARRTLALPRPSHEPAARGILSRRPKSLLKVRLGARHGSRHEGQRYTRSRKLREESRPL